MMRRNFAYVLFSVVGFITFIVISMLFSEKKVVGGFPSGEYRLHFIDNSRNPVGGVTVSVIDKMGENAYNYPVVNYQPGFILASDNNGIVRLQHVDLGPEFSTSIYKIAFIYEKKLEQTPAYTVICSLNNREFFRINYSDMVLRPDLTVAPTTSELFLNDVKISSTLSPRHNPVSRGLIKAKVPIYDLYVFIH